MGFLGALGYLSKLAGLSQAFGDVTNPDYSKGQKLMYGVQDLVNKGQPQQNQGPQQTAPPPIPATPPIVPPPAPPLPPGAPANATQQQQSMLPPGSMYGMQPPVMGTQDPNEAIYGMTPDQLDQMTYG